MGNANLNTTEAARLAEMAAYHARRAHDEQQRQAAQRMADDLAREAGK
jgi:hypothetical protein